MVIFNSYVKLPEGMFLGKLLNVAASSEVWLVCRPHEQARCTNPVVDLLGSTILANELRHHHCIQLHPLIHYNHHVSWSQLFDACSPFPSLMVKPRSFFDGQRSCFDGKNPHC